jgi:hypothetical protein
MSDQKYTPTIVSGSLAIVMLLSVCAFGEPHPLQQLQRQLNEAKATQEAVRHAGDGDGAARGVTPE